MPTIAEQIITVLAANGVRRIWGIPGDSLNGLTDAIRQHDEIEWMHVRHEEAAAFAASADSQISGGLAVCAGSCGPGNLHFINGLFDAQRSRTPVLAIASQVPSSEVGTQYFQETHPERIYRECSVFCEMVTTAEQMPRLLELAIRAAVEEGGVAVLVLTMVEEDASIFAAMRAGARGYVLKGAEPESILRSIRVVASGEAIFGVDVATRLTRFFATPPGTGAVAFPDLTVRERDILTLMATGAANATIAARLGLSEKTVRNNVSNIFAKLRVADRAAAVAQARDAGLGAS